MKMIIIDEFDAKDAFAKGIIDGKQCKNIMVQNPTFIPRIGEIVMWFYEPAPKVKVIVYDYPNDLVWVVIG